MAVCEFDPEEAVAAAPLVAVVGAVGAADVLVDVMTTVVCPPLPLSACSEAPKSVPQFVWYQVITCWFCEGSVQKASQMPLGDEWRLVRYPDWQKQDQVAWFAL